MGVLGAFRAQTFSPTRCQQLAFLCSKVRCREGKVYFDKKMEPKFLLPSCRACPVKEFQDSSGAQLTLSSFKPGMRAAYRICHPPNPFILGRVLSNLLPLPHSPLAERIMSQVHRLTHKSTASYSEVNDSIWHFAPLSFNSVEGTWVAVISQWVATQGGLYTVNPTCAYDQLADRVIVKQ